MFAVVVELNGSPTGMRWMPQVWEVVEEMEDRVEFAEDGNRFHRNKVDIQYFILCTKEAAQRYAQTIWEMDRARPRKNPLAESAKN